jgi:hypothetical protein
MAVWMFPGLSAESAGNVVFRALVARIREELPGRARLNKDSLAILVTRWETPLFRFVSRMVEDPIRWAGVFVGVKLLTFGGTLTWLGWRALKSDGTVVYELEMPAPEVLDELRSDPYARSLMQYIYSCAMPAERMESELSFSESTICCSRLRRGCQGDRLASTPGSRVFLQLRGDDRTAPTARSSTCAAS